MRENRTCGSEGGVAQAIPTPIKKIITSCIINPMERYIMGKNCVREVLKASPERIKKIFVSKPSDEFKSATIKDKDALTRLVDSDSHQGVVALVTERPTTKLKDFLAHTRDRSLVVMLDSIYDPHNLGAILRAAECFGVDAVVWSKNRGADITPAVSKVNVGASELVNIIKVSNLAEAMKQFQKAGYAAVIADVGTGAESLNQFEFPDCTLLILGSEGKGVQRLIKERADHRVYIPMSGQIDSLNVSQAAAILFSKVV